MRNQQTMLGGVEKKFVETTRKKAEREAKSEIEPKIKRKYQLIQGTTPLHFKMTEPKLQTTVLHVFQNGLRTIHSKELHFF